jgi:hypothetical protein
MKEALLMKRGDGAFPKFFGFTWLQRRCQTALVFRVKMKYAAPYAQSCYQSYDNNCMR